MASLEQEFLRRYVEQGDAEAFRELVEGHRDMVFSVCKRMLRNGADAEDAAQNCFLQLARKASSLRPPIAGWLHHVAVQISANMLKQNGRRAAHEARAATLRERNYEPPWEELQGALDDAIAALPERLRIPIILHYLEGRTQEDIAAELGVNQSTLSRRLSAGVDALRRRLLKKGAVLSGAALAALMAANSVEAAPPSLSVTISKVALGGLTTGAKSAATAATIGGIGMVKIGIISTVAAAAVLTVGFVAQNALTQKPPAPAVVVAPAPPPAAVSLRFGRPVTDVLPDSAIAFLEIRDIEAMRLHARGNIVNKLFADPQVAAYVKPLTDKAAMFLQMLDMQLQMRAKTSFDDLQQILSGRVGIALTDINYLGPELQAKAVLLITPRNPAALKPLVNKMLALLPPGMKQRIVTRPVAGINVSEITLDRADMPINWALAGDTLIVGLGTGSTDDVIQHMTHAGSSLSANPTFVQMREKLADYDQDWMYYVSFDRVIAMIKAAGGEDAMKFLAVSGINDLKAIGAAAKLNGPAVDDRLYVLFNKAPAPGRLQSVLSPKPLSADLLRMAPAAADSIAISRFNVPFAYNAFTEILGEMSPAHYAEYRQDVEKANLALGISLEDDFFKAMGDEAMLYNVSVPAAELEKRLAEKRLAAERRAEGKTITITGIFAFGIFAFGTYDGAVIVFKVADAARIQKSMKSFADAWLRSLKGQGGVPEPAYAGVRLADVDHKGVTLHLLEGIPDFTLKPGYAVTEKYLIVAATDKTLASAVDLALAPQDKPNSPVWAAVQAEIAKGVGFVRVDDIRPRLEILAVTFKESLLPTITIVKAASRFGPDPALTEMMQKVPLPAIDAVLRREKLITVTTAKSDRDGVALTGHTMLGTSSVIVPATAVGGGLLLPALSRSREEARRATCANNLMQIGKAVVAWEIAHNNMPVSLADLVPRYIDNPRVFRCPTAEPAARPEGQFQIDYNYIGALPGRVGQPQTIIAYDKPDNHGGAGVNCLYFDGHVSWIPILQFQARLEQSFQTVQPWVARQPDHVRERIEGFYRVPH